MCASLPHFSGDPIPTSGRFLSLGGRISGEFVSSPKQALKTPVDGKTKQLADLGLGSRGSPNPVNRAVKKINKKLKKKPKKSKVFF